MVALKSHEDIDGIRYAGKILAEVLVKLKGRITCGVSTQELDDYIKQQVLRHGGVCAFLGYRSYPANSCISVNEEVVHGIPSFKKTLKEGDIVSIDIGVKFGQYFADAARTYPVGKIDKKCKRLIDTTKKALDLGIKEARAGNFLSNISCTIQRYVESKGFSVVRDLSGHGIGKEIHEEPEIPNFGRPDCGIRLEKGMVLAIEPMVNMDAWQVEILNDGWTVVTKDRLPSAHFEHTVVVLNKSPEVLTRI